MQPLVIKPTIIRNGLEQRNYQPFQYKEKENVDMRVFSFKTAILSYFAMQNVASPYVPMVIESVPKEVYEIISKGPIDTLKQQYQIQVAYHICTTLWMYGVSNVTTSELVSYMTSLFNQE